jgi:hypothetical protein
VLYNQPYGISDPDAAYVNGNVATGTMGSIPPAASIEYDQREIVAVIKWAADHGYYDYANVLCQQPSNADLTQLLKAMFGIMNSTRLTTPKTYYVNGATGDDTYTGTTPSTAFKTLQRAANQATMFNLNGFNVTINVTDNVYGQVFLPPVNGSGIITFIGNTANPVNCRIHANSGCAIYCSGGPYYFNGFRYESDAPAPATPTTAGLPGVGIWSVPGGNIVFIGTNEFGNCVDGHMLAQAGSLAYMGVIRICGNAAFHVAAQSGSWLYAAGAPFAQLVIPAAQTFTYFAMASGGASNTIRYSSVSGQANVSGAKYLATSNGVIDVGGQGTSWLPGSTAGVTNTGGQYV